LNPEEGGGTLMVQKRDKIVFNGIVAEKGIPLAPPIDYELFQKRLVEGLETPKAKPLADALSAYLASIQEGTLPLSNA